MNEYVEFVASLSLEEQYKMPLVEADIETYIGLIDQFINYQAAGLDLLPVTYSNIKAKRIRVFPKAFSRHINWSLPVLTGLWEKLTLSIPLMKTKDTEIAKLLDQNLKDIIAFSKEHDIQFEFGLKVEDHPNPSPTKL